MRTLISTVNASRGYYLQPAQAPETALQDAVAWGASLTIYAGQAVGQKTADNKFYAFASGNSDGTETFKGFSMYTGRTDSNGNFFRGDSSTASLVGNSPSATSPIYYTGIFDPADLRTAATPTANVVTFTPANVEVGDIFTVTYTFPNLTTASISFTATATTAANVVTGLKAAWNAYSTNGNLLTNIATASGTSTFILTAVTAGNNINSALASSTTDGGGTNTQTLAKVNTTPAAGRAIADIQTSRPGAHVLHNGYWRLP